MLDFKESAVNFKALDSLITRGQEGRIFSFKVKGSGGMNAALLRDSLELFLEMRGLDRSQAKEQLDIFDMEVAKTLRFKEIKNYQELVKYSESIPV